MMDQYVYATCVYDYVFPKVAIRFIMIHSFKNKVRLRAQGNVFKRFQKRLHLYCFDVRSYSPRKILPLNFINFNFGRKLIMFPSVFMLQCARSLNNTVVGVSRFIFDILLCIAISAWENTPRLCL